ncbi:MAG: TonB-dependent receptor, partial [Bacteroidota bacterium]
MKITLRTILSLFVVVYCTQVQAQQLTQNIRGTIIDQDAKMPLIGANIMIQNTNPVMGASTDVDGNFRLENVPVGRHNLVVTYLGYEPALLNSILLTTGKELILNIELTESTESLNEVVVVAKHDKNKPLNEMAMVSARSFSVEETSRYAGSYFDPSRMAQNYAGVNLGGGNDDLFNEIIVRGNSPRGVLWRLEGIEIPNPNHFGALGNSGGAISMLSSSTLSNSDFYTGAFPAEFGNATSGVFDLNMRKGNNEKREYAFMLGALGIEAAAEGPFSKNSRASYLINYRYSTLGLLEAIGLNPVDDILPSYQDLSFKINIPTEKAGNFSLFGLGGSNLAAFSPERDSTKWDTDFGNDGFEERQRMGVIGLTHKKILSERSYLKTVVAASHEFYSENYYQLLADENYKRKDEGDAEFRNNTVRISSTYTNKINAKKTLRFGAIFSNMDFSYALREFIDDDNAYRIFLDNEGTTQLYQAFAKSLIELRGA